MELCSDSIGSDNVVLLIYISPLPKRLLGVFWSTWSDLCIPDEYIYSSHGKHISK